MRRGGGFAAASPPRTALFVRARPKYICKLFIYRGTRERPQDARLARPNGPAARRRGGVGFGRARAAVSALRRTAAPRGPPRGFEDRRRHTASAKLRGGVEVPARAARVRDDRPRTERFQGRALAVHSKTCFRPLATDSGRRACDLRSSKQTRPAPTLILAVTRYNGSELRLSKASFGPALRSLNRRSQQ